MTIEARGVDAVAPSDKRENWDGGVDCWMAQWLGGSIWLDGWMAGAGQHAARSSQLRSHLSRPEGRTGYVKEL